MDATLEIPELIIPPQSRKSEFGEITKAVIVPFIVTRLALVAVGLITIYYILPLISSSQPIHSNLQTLPFYQKIYQMWAHFDSGFMTGIARKGYPTGPHALDGMSYWAFFPLYPLAVRLLMFPFGITGNHAVVAGIVVSNISTLTACIYLYKLAKWEFNSVVAQRAVLYMLIYPMGFYLSAVYSEGLFMALSIGCVYHARKRQWLRAGILGGLVSLTRPQGVFLAIAVAWEYWRAHKGLWRKLQTWLGTAYLALIPLGLAIFCLYAKRETGDYLAFIKVEENWGRQSANPILVVWDALQHPIHANPYTWQFYSYNMVIIFLFWFLLLVILRKMPFCYAILTFAYLYMPLASGNIGSVGRLYLITFPIYMIAAWWSARGDEWKHTAIITTCTLLLGLFMAMFVIGVYAIA